MVNGNHNLSVYEQVIELAKRRGFFWPSFSIYHGESGFYDYGPLGVILRDNIVKIWKEAYLSDDTIFIDSPVIVPTAVFRASGHLEKFSDLATECASCHNRQKLETVMKAAGFQELLTTINEAGKFLGEHIVKCVNCGKRITEAYDFKLMFRMPGQSGSGDLFLRPETAQGIFVNFKLLNNFYRNRLPMAVAQLGKGFRNEISPRQSLIRLKEFTQGEVEVFVDPEKKYWKEFHDDLEITLVPRTGMEIKMNIHAALEKHVMSSNAIAYFVHKTFEILSRIGVTPEKLRFRQQHTDELAHYSSDSWDAEAMLDGDWVEIVGIADRNDLKNHQTASGESMSVRIDDRDVIPSVIEPSYGIDRMFLSVLMHSFTINEKGFKVLKLPRDIAPYHAAVFPHLNKDGLDTMAKEFFEQIRRIDPYVTYDQSGSIGKRYARQDEIGTPYCITFDHESLADKSVTVRDRDSAEQIRISVNDLLSGPVMENKKLIEFSRQQAGP